MEKKRRNGTLKSELLLNIHFPGYGEACDDNDSRIDVGRHEDIMNIDR